MFSTLSKTNFAISATFKLSSANALKFSQSMVLSFGKKLTLSQNDKSKLKEFVDNKLKFDKNDGMISKRVENTVGKGEIARHEAFLLFPEYFERPVLQTH